MLTNSQILIHEDEVMTNNYGIQELSSICLGLKERKKCCYFQVDRNHGMQAASLCIILSMAPSWLLADNQFPDSCQRHEVLVYI